MTRRSAATRFGLLGVLLFVWLHGALAMAAPPFDGTKFVQRAEATSARMEKEAYSWTSVQEVNPQVNVHVISVASAAMLRHEIVTIVGEQRTTMFTVIVRDDVWYVKEGGVAAKYRPYAAPAAVAPVYVFLHRAQPMLLTNPDHPVLQDFVRTDAAGMHFRSPLAPEAMRQLSNALKETEELLAKAQRDNNADAAAKMEKMIAQFKAAMKVEEETIIDSATGVLTSYGKPGRRVRLKDFQFLKNVGDAFDVSKSKWIDRTGEISPGKPDRVALIQCAGVWKPGMPTPDLDLRMFNVETGELRRVPYAFGVAESGALSRDRKKIFVTGHVPEEGVIRPFEVDLQTGEHRSLGGDELQRGFSIKAQLSPDGEKLAVMHVDAQTGLLTPRIMVIDIASGEAKQLTEPTDMAWHSWLPDSDGIVVMERRHEDNDITKPETSFLCKIDLSGKRTTLRQGTMPRVLHAARRILFRETIGGDEQWRTCDLDGQDVQPWKIDRRFSFPAPSPDGKQMLMMRFVGDRPTPHLLDMATMSAKPLDLGPGLWAWPQW